jgi:hypothetical protein
MTLLLTNWYKVFYWITRADSVKDFFDTSSNIFTWFAVLSFIALVIISIFAGAVISDNNLKSEEEDKSNPGYRGAKRIRQYISYIFYTTLILSMITWAGYVFAPTKKESLLILAGGGTMQYLTTDSIGKQVPPALSNFVLTELKTMAKEAEVDLGIATQKDKILDEAKKMTVDQLIDRAKTDTTFAKIVLNR